MIFQLLQRFSMKTTVGVIIKTFRKPSSLTNKDFLAILIKIMKWKEFWFVRQCGKEECRLNSGPERPQTKFLERLSGP
jgi:hypothetical protein